MANHTSVAKAELIKPLDGTWQEHGTHLRDLTRLWFRMLNDGIRAAHLSVSLGVSAKDRGDMIYKAVVDFVDEDKLWNACSINTSVKRKKLQPGQIAARGRRAKIKVPSLICHAAYRRAEQAWKVYAATMNEGTRAIPSFEDHTSFHIRDKAWRVEKNGRDYILHVKLHGGRGESTWTQFALGIEGGSMYEHFRRIALLENADKLASKNKLTPEELAERKALQAQGEDTPLTPEQEKRLEALAPTIDVPLGPNSIKRGDLQIRWVEARAKATKEQKREGKKGMWMAYATYTREHLPAVLDRSKVMAIHRGMHSLLTYATLEGASSILIPGDAILEHKRRFQARRDSFRRHRRARGPGGIGHGTDRTHREYGQMQDGEKRYVDSQCQQWAAKAIHAAQAQGCGVILIEDYGTIKNEDPRFIPSWPWAKLKSTIIAAALLAGIEVREVPSAYISQTCPCCGHISAENRQWGSGASASTAAARLTGDIAPGRGDMFHCVSCDFHRHVDPVAAYNMLRTAEGFGPETFNRFQQALRKFQQAIEDQQPDKAAE